MAHNIIRTQIPEHLKPLKVINFKTCRKFRIEYSNQGTLLKDCSTVVNKLPLPKYWHQSAEEISDWITSEINSPEFKETFIRNRIDGKLLILLDADKLPLINIKDFEKIKEITAAIRKHCQIESEDIKRNISLPIRLPNTLYHWYRSRNSGPKSEETSQSEYYRKIHVLSDIGKNRRAFYSLQSHWERIPPYRHSYPYESMGGKKRINPMTATTQRRPSKLTNHPYLLIHIPKYHIPKGEIPPPKKIWKIRRKLGEIDKNQLNTVPSSHKKLKAKSVIFKN